VPREPDLPDQVDTLVVAATAGRYASQVIGQQVPMDGSTTGGVARRGLPLITESFQYPIEGFTDVGERSAIVMPLHADGAVLGVIAKTTVGFRFPRLSTALYLGMGWLIVIAIKPLRENLTASELAWIAAGGLLYTGGVPFYIWKSKRYTHAVWHLFVLAGVAAHFIAVLSVVSPPAG